MISLRKILTLVGILVVLAAAVFAYLDYNEGLWLFKPKGLPLLQTGRTAEDLIPAEPVLYLSLRDGAKLWQQIKGSNFYRRILQLRAGSPRKGSRAPLWSQSERQLEQNLGIRLDEKDLLRLFGRKVVLALYGVDGKKGPDGLLIAETDMATQVWEFLVRFKSKYGKDPAAPQSIPYRGVEIFAFRKPAPGAKGAGFYAFVGKYLMASTRIERLKEAIDLALGSPAAKSYRPQIQKLTADLGKSPFLVFAADTERAFQWIRNAVPPAEEPIFQNRVLGAFKGFGPLVLTASLDKGLLVQTRLSVEPGRMAPQQARAVTRPPASYRSLAFIPEDAMVFAASNSFDARVSWSKRRLPLKVNPRQAPASEKTLERFEKVFGISVQRDLVPLVGSEWAYAMIPADPRSSLPIPRFLVAVQVRSRIRADRLMRRFVGRLVARRRGTYPPFALKHFFHRRTRITYLEIGHLLSPGYTFIKNFLVFATDKDTLVRSLDVSSGRAAAIGKSARFRSAKAHLSAKSNSMFFADGNSIADSLERVLAMAGSLRPALAKSQGKGPSLPGALDLFRVAPVMVGDTVNGKGQVSSRFFAALSDIPKTPKALPAPGPLPPALLALLNPSSNPPALSAAGIAGKARGKRGPLRDPFRPVILPEKVLKALEHRVVPSTPLQRYDLSSLRLVGIIWGALGRKALIEAPDGKGYSVEVNTRIGSRGGVIKEVRDNGIVVQEKHEDPFGKIRLVNVFIALKRERAAGPAVRH